ncbi:MAG TPA: M20 family metallopeptidase [Methylomirabilota bacterium]|jgi:glutamate carboxypeptidase|nr:M20 family metallopeptidase [Methylomirabilota bacterium]
MGFPLFAWLDAREAEAIRLLEALVNQDSGTYDREDVNRLAEMLVEPLRELGFAPTRFPQTEYGDHWLWEGPGRGPKRLLCVSHLDTVFARGTARTRPFAIHDVAGRRRATGPGIYDQKGGIVAWLFALRAIMATDSPAWREARLAWFWNSDEEVLSPTSRALIRAEAARAQSVAVTEPARPDGEYVIGRKGAGRYFLEITGTAAHAGNQPEVGRSAVWAMAQKVDALHRLTDLAEGTTVNVGVVRGGDRANVVAERCYAEIDLRAWTPAAAEKAVARFREIAEHPHLEGTTARLWGDLSFPPWAPGDPGTMALLALLQDAGRELGLALAGIRTGGGSDGNHASQVAPTIDGLGPQGSFAHSPDEYIELPTLIERAKVNARFIELWTDRFRR